jgi:hypothetical protein
MNLIVNIRRRAVRGWRDQREELPEMEAHSVRGTPCSQVARVSRHRT